MTNEDFIHAIRKPTRQAERDGDSFLVVHFSASQDKYRAWGANKFDMGDALIVIGELAKQFNLDPDALASSLISNTLDDMEKEAK